MKADKERDIVRIMTEGTLVDAALREAVQEALWRHKRLGFPIVVWRRGKVVRIPPGRIRVSDPRRRRGKRPGASRRR